MATVVVPNLQRRLPGYQRKAFVTELNALLAFGWQQALSMQKIQRIFFDFSDKTIKVETQEIDQAGTITHKPIMQAYQKTKIKLPETLEFKNFFINGADELHKPGRETSDISTAAWFFIIPDGMCQEVILNVVDTSQGANIQLGLVINPFTAQLKEYDTFQKP